MRNVLHTFLFQIAWWIFAFSLLGIPVYFFMHDMQECLDPSMPYDFWTGMATNVMAAIPVGILLGSVDLLMQRLARRRRSFRSWFLIKSGLYLMIFLVTVVIVGIAIRLPQAGDLQASTDEAMSEGGLYIMVGYVIFSGLFSLIISFFSQIRKMFGKGVLAPMFLGRYFTPKTEDRIFMFLDLKSSTTVAEQLGHFKFCRLIQDCFYDLNRVVEQFDASIYKYVGDEAILTWRQEKGLARGNCVRIFFAFKERLNDRLSHYQSQYSWTPEFTAGVNMGETTVGEIGEVKREIAYHGDVLNTAARLQAACKTYDQDLIISEVLHHALETDPSYHVSYVDEVSLKGKASAEKVFGVRSVAS